MATSPSGSPFDQIGDVPDDIGVKMPSSTTGIIAAPTGAYDPVLWARRPKSFRRIWMKFEEPGSSWSATLLNVLITLLVVLALVAFVAETLPQNHGRNRTPFPEIEVFCTAMFLLEYVVRLACCPMFKPFLLDMWNIADFLALLPLPLEKILAAAGYQATEVAIMRVVRLTRIMKLVRAGRRNKNMAGMLLVFSKTMARSWDSMKLLMFFELLTLIVSGSVIFYIERGDFNHEMGHWMVGVHDGDCTEQVLDGCEKSQFQNVFVGMYWTLVTVTGVGYGDMVPLSIEGKFATFFTILSGLVLIALPVSIIGGNFAAVYMEFNRGEIQVRYRAVGAAAAFAIGGVRRRREDHVKTMQVTADQMGGQTRIDPEALSTSFVPANDVCAGLYMEHLLRSVANIDDHILQSVDMMVAEQFCHIMKHVHRFSLDQEYAQEASEWQADLWKTTGVGAEELPFGFLGKDVMTTIRALKAAARAKARVAARRQAKKGGWTKKSPAS